MASIDLTLNPERLKLLKGSTITANGTEQILVEYDKLAKIIGYVDLSNLVGSDEISIRQYMKLKTDGNYKKYAEESYSGVQSSPVIYITLKESVYGVKVTLQQTVGAMKDFDYQFLKEE